MREKIIQAIETFVSQRMQGNGTRTHWDTPLIGFAEADDPLFVKLKEAVRPTHATPSELLPGARTVIVYFLPFSREIPRSNQLKYNASREWAVAYVETNQLIIDLNHHLSHVLKEQGYDSKVLPPTHNFDTEQLMADWSHKHIAYIAGFGKFGAHHMLITEKGCCGRFGSLVTNAVIKPTPRPEGEFCLSVHDGSCKACITKCPVGALTEEFYDRHKCYDLLLENAEIYAIEGMADVCGKCTSIVPCSFTNPVKAKNRKK
jgi:epoxyqueuosine reductase QueG